MTEDFFLSFWLNVLDTIKISSKVEGKIDYIEIVRDTITVFSKQRIMLPSSDRGPGGMTVHQIPFQYSIFKNNRIPSLNEIDAAMAARHVNDCQTSDVMVSGNHGSIFNVFAVLRHDRAHVNEEISSIKTHTHFNKINNDNLNVQDVRGILNCYEKFNHISASTIINKNEINRLVSLFQQQLEQMNKQAKTLAYSTAKNFIVIAVCSFCTHLITTYILPALLYHENDSIRKNSQLILGLVQALQPLVIFINALANFQITPASLLIHLANITAQFNNVKFLPNEFFQFVNLIRICSSDNITEKDAEEAGLCMANILGNTSAKALGKIFSSACITYFPKLKKESAPSGVHEHSEAVQRNKDINPNLKKRR